MVEAGHPKEEEFPLYSNEDQGEEDPSGSGAYPQRPGETECQYYMKTGTCKYATKCKFHHPPDVTPSWGTVAPATDVTIGLNKESYPRRPGEQQCTFFLKTGTCKYKMSCKFDHPPEAIQQTLQLQSTPYPVRPGELQCAYYLKTGKCKFGATCRFDHPPMAPEQVAALVSSGQYPQQPMPTAADGRPGAPMSMAPRGPAQPMGYYPPHHDGAMMGIVPPPGHAMGFHPQQLPQRPGEKECTFFLRTGRCQYGPRCKFHHPVEKLAGNLAALNGMSHPGAMGHPMGPPFPHPVEAYAGYPPAGLPMAPRPPQAGPGGQGDGALPSRPGQEACSFYMRTGKCSYGATCRFDHPRNTASRETSAESGGSNGGAANTTQGGSGGEGGAGAGAGQYQGNAGDFQQHHMQYGMQVNGNAQGGYPPIAAGYGEPQANGMYQGPPGGEYGSPQGFMGYPPHPGSVQYPGQAGNVYGNYRQSS